jgi:deoxyribodipyrimidine photo-lyase
MKHSAVVMWFRRDLRLEDNAALYHALNSGIAVLPLFIFDKEILDKLEDKADKRVQFIHTALLELKNNLNILGSDLMVKYGRPEEVWKTIFETYSVQGIFSNKDYEPYALERDANLAQLANAKGASFKQFKDQCIFEFNEVLKDDGKPYTVFTPYSKKWKAKLATQQEFYLKAYATEEYFDGFIKDVKFEIPSLKEMGFEALALKFPAKESSVGLIRNYKETRDYPAIEGTSRLGVHFRFGTISIRAKARKALGLSETYLNELIWRDFYMQILAHFPHVAKGAFKPAYDKIAWRNNEAEFAAWCAGKTGYPIVDAGMRELNSTGFMHNRVRMIVASFLTKHLLIDWRWGEAYFAKKLLDFDLSANNGGWQWAAGSGTDAAPYFRVFNPALQTAKFDAKGEYIKKWVPELGSIDYPKPIVVHELARKRCLETYKAALG